LQHVFKTRAIGCMPYSNDPILIFLDMIETASMAEKTEYTWWGIPVCVLLTVLVVLGIFYHFDPVEPRPAFFELEKPEAIVSAIKSLSDAQLADIRKSEAKRFAKSPLDSDALENLLLIANIRGDAVSNEKLVKLAADRTLRNYTAQFAAIQLSMARKNYDDVMFRFDGLIRTQLSQRPELFAMLAGLARDADANKALAKVLATSPPWRGEFMNEALGKVADAESAYQILSNLKKSEAPPNSVELRVIINRLLAEKKDDTAYFIWLDFLNEVELRKVKAIFDGGFELEPKQRFFDWTIGQTENSQAGVAERSAGSPDRALKVQFSGSTGFYGQVQQMTRVTPGKYVFRGQAKAQDLKTTGGVNWKFYCHGTNRLLMQSRPLTNDTDWSQFEVQFEIPETACATQFLRLETAATAALDMKLSGTVLFDDLVISSRDARPEAGQGQ
jgi:hypothetical protein